MNVLKKKELKKAFFLKKIKKIIMNKNLKMSGNELFLNFFPFKIYWFFIL